MALEGEVGCVAMESRKAAVAERGWIGESPIKQRERKASLEEPRARVASDVEQPSLRCGPKGRIKAPHPALAEGDKEELANGEELHLDPMDSC